MAERLGPRKLATIGYAILALATVGAFFATWWNAKAVERARVERIHQLNHINAEQCASLRNLYSIIQETIAKQDLTVDVTAYYRSHPAERRRRHMEDAAIIERFRLPPCPKKILLPR